MISTENSVHVAITSGPDTVVSGDSVIPSAPTTAVDTPTARPIGIMVSSALAGLRCRTRSQSPTSARPR